jgi:hypothetical protein
VPERSHAIFTFGNQLVIPRCDLIEGESSAGLRLDASRIRDQGHNRRHRWERCNFARNPEELAGQRADIDVVHLLVQIHFDRNGLVDCIGFFVESR